MLSIIIPTLNSGKLINNSLLTIANQTFTDYEIVIQDGVSTDNTILIIEEIKKQYPSVNIRTFIEKDKGIYDAMNKALKKVRGEWIYFLGSDDKLYDNEVLQTIFDDNTYKGYDVIYGNVYSTRFNGLFDGSFDAQKICKTNICHQSIFFKKSVFRKVGVFDTRFKAHADWEHNMRWFFSKKIKSKYIDVVVADYADGGFSSVQGDEKFAEIKKLIYLKYVYKKMSLKTKLSWFRDALYLKRKNKDLKGIFGMIKYLPYVLYPL